jgi:hypothetical protein
MLPSSAETKRGQLGSTWGQPGFNLGSTWGHPGVNLGSTLGQSGVNRGSTWGQPGVNLGSTWGQSGVNLGPTWGQPGVNLRLSWGQPGVNLGSTWGHPGFNMHHPTMERAHTSQRRRLQTPRGPLRNISTASTPKFQRPRRRWWCAARRDWTPSSLQRPLS